jgi:hypothetical protein
MAAGAKEEASDGGRGRRRERRRLKTREERTFPHLLRPKNE